MIFRALTCGNAESHSGLCSCKNLIKLEARNKEHYKNNIVYLNLFTVMPSVVIQSIHQRNNTIKTSIFKCYIFKSAMN